MENVYLTDKKVVLNFSKKYCKSSLEIIESEIFKKILFKFINSNLDKNDYIFSLNNQFEFLSDEIIHVFKLCLLFDIEDIKNSHDKYNTIVDKDNFYNFVEDLYDFWRKFERYSILYSNFNHSVESSNFLDFNNDFTNLILKTYRQISKSILKDDYNVLRELPAGVNAGIKVIESHAFLGDHYKPLNDIDVIDKIMIKPPFITYTKKNKRDGVFLELKANFINEIDFSNRDFFCLKAMIGTSLAFIYFDIDYLHQAIPLANLFHIPKLKDVENKNPDVILIFGGKTKIEKPSFYVDKELNRVCGICPYGEDIDYFGYMKKMLLTLHNIKLIENDILPVHGAFVTIELFNGIKKNICIIGDSGAGKSETLESFRVLAKDYLKSMKIVFDDMGCFFIENNTVYARGTETGAFVRLDDLENGYPYEEMDRSIFINPNKTNARVVIPVSTYENVVKNHKIDFCLYANNYDNGLEELEKFSKYEEAKEKFIAGKRFAKGTTTENGIVESYFANPFGPVQRIEKCEILFKEIFTSLFNNNIFIGEIFTKLGIKGYEQVGPKKAAEKLLNYILGS